MDDRTVDARPAMWPPPISPTALKFGDEALAWIALCPAWPEQLATAGFPASHDQLVTGPPVAALLQDMQRAGLLEAGPGEAPWRGTWYRTVPIRRVAILEHFVQGGKLSFLDSQLRRIGEALARPRWALPPAIGQFAELAGAGSGAAMGDLLLAKVGEALQAAERAKAISCPEASRWIETAEGLTQFFPGVLDAAVARARGQHELFLRRSRDARYLRHYTQRRALEQAFLDLLSDDAPHWALHYLGEGGMGKTMLVRRITAAFAPERNLVTSRIDFDYVNPDYPERAPGLLLQILADDLRLDDDERAQVSLRKFSDATDDVHRRIENISRSARTDGMVIDEAKLQELLEESTRLFIDALEAIAQRRRPILILDTCEELTRLRPSGELPKSVLRTFELLERLHDAVPSLRVVFSGRRPLVPPVNEQGQPCVQMTVARVFGFDEQEADGYLAGFEEQGRRLDPASWPGIKKQSRVDAAVAGAISRAPDPDQRYNPYDLALYARWMASASTPEETTRIEALLASGAHLYVRERIVLRVSPPVRPWLPVLVLLGHFDRELLAAVAGGDSPDFARVFDELIDQEWVEPDRGARWARTQPAGGATSGPSWVVDRNLKARLAAYYQQEEPDVWRTAISRLRPVVRSLSVSRPWSELTPEYFVLAFELLSNHPAELAGWWADVEAKMLADDAWDWAKQVLDALPIQPTEEDRQKYPGASAALEHTLRAAVLATQAARDLRAGDVAARPALWASVLAEVPHHPIESERAVLAFRAHAGMIVNKGIAYFRASNDDREIAALERVLHQLPAVPAVEGPAARQVAAAELAVLENSIEILEQVSPASPSRALTGRLRSRLDAFIERRVPGLWPVAAVLRARLSSVTADAAFHADLDRAIAATRDAGSLDEQFLDWMGPADVPVRLQLEVRRLGRTAGPDTRRILRESATVTPSFFHTLDEERAAAAALLILSDRLLPETPPEPIIERSVQIDATERATCYAHRAVHAYFQVALTVMAERGEVDRAVNWCQRIAHNSELPLHTRQAADRALLIIVVRWRLRDMGLGVQTTIHESTATHDRVLVEDAKAFDPSSATKRTSLEEVDPNSVEADGQFRFRRSLRQSRGDDVPPSSMGRRLAARLLLAEGSVLSLTHPTATTALANAAAKFAEAEDPVGEWQTWATIALAAARAGDRKRLEEAVQRTQEALVRALRLIQTRDAPSEIPIELTEGEHGLSRQRLTAPWLFRVVAARGRLEEFDEPGPVMRAIEQWGISSGGLAPDCQGVLTTPVVKAPAAAQHEHPAPVRSQRVWWIDVIKVAIGGVIGLGIVAGMMWGFYAAHSWALTRVVGEVSTGLRIGAFFITFLIVAVLFESRRRIPQWVVGRLLRFAEPNYTIVPWVEAQPAAGPRPRRVSIQFAFGSKLRIGRPRLIDLEEGQQRSAYARRAVRIASKVPTKATSFIHRLMRGRGTPVDIRLFIAEGCAAEPWEAFIDLAHGATAAAPRFRYRRFTSWLGHGFSRLIGDQRPFLHSSVVVMARSLEGAGSLQPSELRGSGILHAAGIPVHTGPLVLGARGTDTAGASDLATAAALVVCEAVAGDSGLMLQFEEPERTRVFPSEINQRYPGLRLLVLFSPWRIDTRRLGGDAVQAQMMRQIASQLYAHGIPSVLALPALHPDDVTAAVVRIARLLADRPARATEAVTAIAYEIQQKILGRQAAVDGGSAPTDESAGEAAFDVCLYCNDPLDLSLPVVRPQHAPTADSPPA